MTKRLNYTEISASPYQSLLALDKAVKASGVEAKTIHLIKIRASQLNGCLFCLDLHTKEAVKDGESNLRLTHLAAWRESALFTAAERAALEWTELVTRLDGKGIAQADYEAARQALGDQTLSDLTFAITVINAWNRLGVAFTPQPGSLDKALGLPSLV